MFARGATVVAALATLAIAAPASADDRIIAPGVGAGGVDLGGLTVDAAAAKLTAALAPALTADLVLTARERGHRLTAAQAKLRFDALRTAKRAAQVKPDQAPPPAAGGATAAISVPLALSHSRLAVAAWLRKIAPQFDRAPRDASLSIRVDRVTVRPARVGLALDRTATAAEIDAALDSPVAPRAITAKLRSIRPAVTAASLRSPSSTVVTVDRDRFTLRLFKGTKLRKRYRIAVGMAGLETPAGRYRIANRQVDPAWHVPRSSWAGSLQGKVIPGGAPNNPLKARWLGIANGVGIHGTAEEWSIGSRASHGCIRMKVADVIDLFGRVPVGAPVLIK